MNLFKIGCRQHADNCSIRQRCWCWTWSVVKSFIHNPRYTQPRSLLTNGLQAGGENPSKRVAECRTKEMRLGASRPEAQELQVGEVLIRIIRLL